MSKRASNGEGSITLRNDGRWMGRMTIDGVRKTVYGKSRPEVKKKLKEWQEDVIKGEYVDVNKLTVGEWLDGWLKEYALPSVRQSTYVSYEGNTRLHVKPEIGDIKLQSLSNDNLQRLFNVLQQSGNKVSKNKGLSPKTLHNIYNMLHAALDQAIINKKIKFNPIMGVKLPKIEDPEMRVFTRKEQGALTDAALNSPELQAFGIIFDLSTGVRVGELVGLKWGDLNLEKHTVMVRRTVERLMKINAEETEPSTEIVIGPPKTKKSIREIPLFSEIWNDLMKYKKRQDELKEQYPGVYDDQDYIFCFPDGRLIEPRTYADLFDRTIKKAKIKKANIHSMRHTFATRALESGMDINTLSVLLGHSHPSITLNRYGHVLPNQKKSSMNRMSNFYSAESLAYLDEYDDESDGQI